MKTRTRRKRGDGRADRRGTFVAPVRAQAGFTIIELLVSIGAVLTVIMATVATYLGTTRSWEGTSTLTRVQREASFALEVMGRAIRKGSTVDIGAAGDSLRILFWTGSTDSLVASFYVDDQGCLRNHTGMVLVDGADSLSFVSSNGRTVNIDIVIRGDMGTEQATSDDHLVLMSSTISCRN